MIKRPGQQQLLLPVSPFFMWTSLVVALLVNMVPIGRAVWMPDLLALVIDRDLSIPVQNTRTGVRSVAFGDASAHGGGLELRFMAANADLQEGDLLSTSGVDGIYPAGLPVAKIERIERRADSAFARIYCVPLAHVTAARYVLVLEPTGTPAAPAAAQRKRPEGKPGAGKNEKKPAGARP